VLESLRVAHVNTETGWRGGEQQLAWLAQGLNGRGHSCLVICNRKGQLARRAPELGLEVRPVPVRGEIGFRSVKETAAALREFEPHIVHLHDAHAVLVGALAAKLAGSPAVVVSRRVDFRINSRWKYTWAIDRIIAISAAVRAVLIDCGVPPQRICVVHSAIDLARLEELPAREPARQKLGLAAGELAVGMIAALTDHKGHRFLLEGWPRVIEREPRARLLLAGDGELADELKGLVARLGIGGSVRFLGFWEDVPGLLAALDLFALSSHLEGLCTSLMDAMAAGLPVAATRAGGIPEVVAEGRTGMLVPERNPDALAEAILGLLADPERRRHMGEAGRERVRSEFGLQSMVEGTLAAYAGVLRKKGLL